MKQTWKYLYFYQKFFPGVPVFWWRRNKENYTLSTKKCYSFCTLYHWCFLSKFYDLGLSMGVLEEMRLICDGLTWHTRVMNVSDTRRRIPLKSINSYKIFFMVDTQVFFLTLYPILSAIMCCYDLNINYKIYSVLLLILSKWNRNK